MLLSLMLLSHIRLDAVNVWCGLLLSDGVYLLVILECVQMLLDKNVYFFVCGILADVIFINMILQSNPGNQVNSKIQNASTNVKREKKNQKQTNERINERTEEKEYEQAKPNDSNH